MSNTFGGTASERMWPRFVLAYRSIISIKRIVEACASFLYAFTGSLCKLSSDGIYYRAATTLGAHVSDDSLADEK